MNISDDDDDCPEIPPLEDCCGNGCDPCILDVHKKLLEKWKEKKLRNQKPDIKLNLLSESTYRRFSVSSTYSTCEGYTFLCLEFSGSVKEDAKLIFNPGQYMIIRILSISRSYTPILWSDTSFTILVKFYEKGKMSSLIKEIEIGTEVHVRGPYGHFMYHQNSYRQIVMICIGSGIAATYPVAKSIVLDDSEETRIFFISGFRFFSKIPLKEELRFLSDYWNFSCTIFLSQEKKEDILTGIKLINSRLNSSSISEVLQSHPQSSTLVLICGTKEFNEMVKRTVEENNFHNYHIF